MARGCPMLLWAVIHSISAFAVGYGLARLGSYSLILQGVCSLGSISVFSMVTWEPSSWIQVKKSRVDNFITGLL